MRKSHRASTQEGRGVNLRGRTPALGDEHCATALLLIDLINHFEFPGAERLLRAARSVAAAAAALKERCVKHQVPVIYVNDNFGRWRSDLRSLVRHCLRPQAAGREVVTLIEPAPNDYFVLKPQNSAFYSTVLETLLRHLGVRTVILCGLATDNCILFSAHDAYLRKFELFVPRDGCAAESTRAHRDALELIARNTKADLRLTSKIPLPPPDDAAQRGAQRRISPSA